MVRVEREEQVFEREAILGRDAESVFPTELKAASENEANAVTNAVKEALGSVKFVTESQVEEIKNKEGGGAGAESSKPLSQVLHERKQQKNDEFQEQWKLMKQGKNRPLDADELEFLESVEAKKRKVEDSRKAEEETELLAFQLAREQATTTHEGPKKTTSSATAKPSLQRQRKPQSILRVKPVVVPRKEVEGKRKQDAGVASGLSLLGDYGSDSD
ncbi:N-terminal domain of NEFA-interacting nuclear protein NIP30-domain-containing protein [Chloropicon primus]|nr:N-terminal domain of NEFA-interacting nuclear protein NIP30-domain-containing protein [Chloropicon primus]